MFSKLLDVATNSEIQVNPVHTVFFYNIKVMGNVSYRILVVCVDNTSFTNSLTQI